MHLKRNNIGKFWPIPRKGTKFLAVATHNMKSSIPLVIVIRDILKLTRNKKELKRFLNEKLISVNGKKIRETNYPIGLFDIISIVPSKKSYRIILSDKKKFKIEEISDADAKKRVYKVLNKTVLRKNKIQLNLESGKNILSQEKINTGDSVLLNLNDNKILKILPMKKGGNAYILKGRHAGVAGKVKEITEINKEKFAKISVEKEIIEVNGKNIMMIE